MNANKKSVNCRELCYKDIATYIEKKPIQDLRLYELNDQEEPMQDAIKELEKNDAKKDFIKKIIVAPDTPAHTSVLIYGVCDGKKFCFTLSTDISRSFMPYIMQKLGQNDEKKSEIEFLLSDIHVDAKNCGVFAVECCKHLNLDNFRKLFVDKQKNLEEKSVMCSKIFCVKTKALPSTLQKYDQQIKSENIAELKQNPEKYNQFKKKIKKKNFVIRNNSIRCKYLFKNLGEEEYVFDKIRPENLMNKAASYKRKKIVDLADQKKKENGIG